MNDSKKVNETTTFENLIEKFRTGNYLERRKAIREMGNRFGKSAFEYYIEALNDDNDDVIKESLNILVKLECKTATHQLLSLIKRSEPIIIRPLFEALKNLGDHKIIPHLLDLLDYPSNAVKRNTIDIISQLSSKYPNTAYPAINSFFKLLSDEYIDTRKKASLALYNLGFLVPLLEKQKPYSKIKKYSLHADSLLQTLKSTSIQKKKSAIEEIISIGDSFASQGLVELILEENDEKTRDLAAKALQKFNDFSVVDNICNGIKEKDDTIKLRIYRALSFLKCEKSEEILIDGLEEKNPKVCKEVARSLVQYRYTFNKQKLLETITKKHLKIHANVIYSLGYTRDKMFLPYLKNIIFSPKNSDLKSGAVTALGEIGGEETVDILIQVLESKESYRAWAAKSLGQISNDKAIDPLIKALKDEDMRVRMEAATALRFFNAPKSYQPLLDLASTKDRDLSRICAIESIKKITDEKVLAPIVNDLTSGDYKKVNDALIITTTMKDSRLAEIYLQVLNTHSDENIRKAAIYDLTSIEEPCEIPLILQALEQREERIKQWALKQLSISFHPSIVPKLLSIIKNSDATPNIKKQAILTLSQIKDIRALKDLVKMLHDKESQFREEVKTALSNFGENAFPIYLKLFESSDDISRITALRGMVKTQKKEAHNYLVKALNDTSLSDQESALGLLEEYENDEAIEPLLKLLDDKNFQHKRQLLELLSKYTDKIIAPVLNQLLDEDLSIQRKAVNIIGHHGNQRALSLFLHSLESKDSQKRIAAIRGLKHLHDFYAIKPLIRELASDEQEIKEEAISAIDSLRISAQGKYRDLDAEKEIWQEIKNDEVLLSIYKNALKDDSYKVRAHAAQKLGRFMEDETSVEELIEALKNESNRDYIYVKYKASQKRPDSRNIVKREIISSLGKLKDKRATKPIIDEMKMNKDKLLLLIGISTLEQLDFEESIDAFHMILDNKQEYPKDVVTNVIDALGTIGDPLSKERLLNVLGDYQDIASVALAKIGGSGMSQILFNQWLTQNKYECKETAKALGLIDDPEIVSKMIDFIKNDQDIEKARSTLRYMKNAEDALIELVQDSNPFLRLVAIDILCHIKTKKSIPILKKATRDSEPPVQLAANKALKDECKDF